MGGDQSISPVTHSVYYYAYIEGLFIPSASMGCMYAEDRGYVLPSQDADCSPYTLPIYRYCSPQVPPSATLHVDMKSRYNASVSFCSLSFGSPCNVHTSRYTTHTESASCTERMYKQSSVEPKRQREFQVLQHKRSCHRKIAAASIADISENDRQKHIQIVCCDYQCTKKAWRLQ